MDAAPNAAFRILNPRVAHHDDLSRDSNVGTSKVAPSPHPTPLQ